MSMFRMMHALLSTRTPWGMGIPAIFTGPPGTGKTSTIRDYALTVGRYLELISPGERGEAVMGAVPAVKGDKVYYPVPDWTENVGASGIICIDEVRTAPLVIRPALLGLLLDRRCGGWQAGKGVSIIGFSNSTDDSPNGAPLEAAVTNRVCNLAWEPGSLEDALGNMKNFLNGVHPSHDLAVPTAFDLDKAHRIVAGFLRKHPDMRQEKPRIDGAWASDRSWTLAACCLAAADAFKLSDNERQAMIDGCVGLAAGAKFATAAIVSLPNIEDILADNSIWMPHTERPDEAKAVADAAAATGDIRAWKLIHMIMSGPHPDAAVPAFQNMLTNKNLPTDDEWFKKICLRSVATVQGELTKKKAKGKEPDRHGM